VAERIDIYIQRNEDWARALFLTDNDGVPIDLTGMTAAMQVRDKLNQILVAEAEIVFVDAFAGEIGVTLRASEGSPLSDYGAAIQTANLHYDLRLTDSDGLSVVLFGGILVLSRGETRA